MKRTIILLLVCITSFACKKLDDIKTPEFNVTTEKTSYKINEEIDFLFTGDADVISVYSGETGNDYNFTNGRVMQSSFEINFATQMQNGTQQDQLKILLSKNFNEDYSLTGVAQADWIDITNKFTFPSSPSSTFINSGWGDITSELGLTENAKIYLAVKQIVRDQSIYGTGRLNRIRDLKLQATNELGSTTIFSHAIANWTLFSTPNKESDRQAIEASQMTLRNNWRTPNVYTEDWVVSIPITLSPLTDMGPDLAIGVKNLADKMPQSYKKAFIKAGNYKVTFKAINQSVKGRKEIIKQIPITIEN